MVWSHPSITRSWHRNAKGRVTVLSPWRLVDHWRDSMAGMAFSARALSRSFARDWARTSEVAR